MAVPSVRNRLQQSPTDRHVLAENAVATGWGSADSVGRRGRYRRLANFRTSSPSTITRWHERWLVKLRLNHLQLDELVVRVRTLSERVFVWTAMDSLTKLLVSVHVGSRKKDDAMRIVHDVKTRLQPDCIPVFTSDGLNLYFYAITAHFGQWVSVVGKRLPV